MKYVGSMLEARGMDETDVMERSEGARKATPLIWRTGVTRGVLALFWSENLGQWKGIIVGDAKGELGLTK